MGNYKSGAFVQFAREIDLATHLLNDFLADAEAQPRAFLIYAGVLIEFTEVNKQIFLIFFWNANSVILELYGEFELSLDNFWGSRELKILRVLINFYSLANLDALRRLSYVLYFQNDDSQNDFATRLSEFNGIW